MANNNQRGGNRNAGKTQRMDQAPNENQRMTAEGRLTDVLRGLGSRRKEVEHVLPHDITFESFYSAVKTALLNNPDILDATPMSIVNASVKAAYDGLRLDGREAALVTHRVRVSKDPDIYEIHAQYFPMVFGLVQQILRGGEVVSIEAEVVFEKDNWNIERGTNPVIFHQPNMLEAPGAMLFAYSVATLKNGMKTTAFLRGFEIEDVMKSSRSGWHERDQKPIGVWARWPRQMWLKTVLRFHRKTLPLGDRLLIDKEQEDLFPGMQQKDNPMGLTAPAPPRPRREDQQALQHQQGDEPLDFGNRALDEQREAEMAEQTKPAAKAKPKAQEKKAADKPTGEIPADAAEWSMWASDVTAKVKACGNMDALTALHSEHADAQAEAPQAIRDQVAQDFSDRAADLAADPGDGAAAGESGTDNAAGDN